VDIALRLDDLPALLPLGALSSTVQRAEQPVFRPLEAESALLFICCRRQFCGTAIYARSGGAALQHGWGADCFSGQRLALSATLVARAHEYASLLPG
jgi:hypothetical protein